MVGEGSMAEVVVVGEVVVGSKLVGKGRQLGSHTNTS